jgi:hypothetical protein
MASYSDTPMPHAEAPVNGNAHFMIEGGVKEPYPFYINLFQWDTNDIMPKLAAITEAILQGDGLFICANGSFIKEREQGAQAWVLAGSNGTVLWRGAGPSVGNPEAMMAYMAELCSLTFAFFLLLWVCNESDIQHENAVITCDFETTLHEVFKNPLTNNIPYAYLAADIDLITCVRDLLLEFPLEVHLKKEWVKGHYKGEKPLKRQLNDMADELAVAFNSKWQPPAISNIYSPLK